MPRALVLAGMHRSGTSLLASVVLRAGVDLGSAFLPPGRGNRRGHFEDLDFYSFHQGCLERREIGLFSVPDGWTGELTPGEEAEARELVARRADKPLWGFKDPRTTLFLDAWDRLLPDPLYLLLYRHPVEVALSLLRRGIDQEVQDDPRAAFRTWMSYNERILQFRRANPGRCLLWNVAGAVGSLDESVGRLEAWLGARLDRDGLDGLFHGDELRGLQAQDIDWPSTVPEAWDLYQQLEEAADLPGGEGASHAEPSRQVKELLESNEHLLAAALRGSSCEAVSAARLGDQVRLRLLAAQQQEDLCAIQEAQARLEATMGMRTLRRYWRIAGRVHALLRKIRRVPVPAVPAGSSSLPDRAGALPS